MSEKLVTVCLPIHKNHVFLERCLISASAQDYSNIEFLILINSDLFTEQTQKKIANIFKERNYRIVDASQKLGVGYALNQGIKEMNGHYFAWLSSDDYWEKDRISDHIKILEKENQDVGLCWSGWKNITESETVLSQIAYTHGLDNSNKFYNLFSGRFNGCSITIRREVFNNVGLFDENLLYTQDYDMWFRIISKYDICISDKILTYYQLHSKQTTRTENIEDELVVLWSNFIKNINHTILDETKNSKLELIILMYEIFISGQFPKVLTIMKEALRQELSYEPEISLKITKQQILRILMLNESALQGFPTAIQQERDQLGVLAHGYRELYQNATETIKNYDSRKIIRLLRKFKLF
jgi:GT2 family glycosyltransferase